MLALAPTIGAPLTAAHRCRGISIVLTMTAAAMAPAPSAAPCAIDASPSIAPKSQPYARTPTATTAMLTRFDALDETHSAAPYLLTGPSSKSPALPASSPPFSAARMALSPRKWPCRRARAADAASRAAASASGGGVMAPTRAVTLIEERMGAMRCSAAATAMLTGWRSLKVNREKRYPTASSGAAARCRAAKPFHRMVKPAAREAKKQ
mmetsp:Transcript_40738/g.79770  ORF Transcript_40738/g.79770 Transcript_40738/m.79770 type:complete len:209 (+) Transcript_40738:521-1147(+)